MTVSCNLVAGHRTPVAGGVCCQTPDISGRASRDTIKFIILKTKITVNSKLAVKCKFKGFPDNKQVKGLDL